jgi:chromosome partitioning protein
VRTIAFFNTRSGAGKTTLVYHLSHLLADLGEPVLAVDLDPQANLTSMFLDDSRLERLLSGERPATIFGAVGAAFEGGDVLTPVTHAVAPGLSLIASDPALATAEEALFFGGLLSAAMQIPVLPVMMALSSAITRASEKLRPEWVLLDLGSSAGALNHSALLAADGIVIPLTPDFLSIHALKGVGASLDAWRKDWQDRRPQQASDLPFGGFRPLGYVVMYPRPRETRWPHAYERWVDLVPPIFREAIAHEPRPSFMTLEDDSYCLGVLKQYASLRGMAADARKPVFNLTPADGAIGAYAAAARGAYGDFRSVARALAARCSASLA